MKTKTKLQITTALAVVFSAWLGIHAAETNKIKDAELYAAGAVFIVSAPKTLKYKNWEHDIYTREDTVIETCYEPKVTFNATNKVWEIRFK